MESIKNYYKVNEKLATSGQPDLEEFLKISEAGYDSVINLALPSSINAIEKEGSIVTSLGMNYIHIPVEWETPKMEDVEVFFQMMQALNSQKIWVHCAMNMRVSCFVYLYQKHILKMSEEEASFPMKELWKPEGVWGELVEQTNQKYS